MADFVAMRSLAGSILVSVLLLPTAASAKRIPAPRLEPVVYGGVRYTVPNDKGTVAYVEAWDVATGERLWKKTIFRTWICPIVEHCIQWVFINDTRLEDGRLVIASEKEKVYSLDLKTRQVRKLKQKTEMERR